MASVDEVIELDLPLIPGSQNTIRNQLQLVYAPNHNCTTASVLELYHLITQTYKNSI
jgi:hypothetical protein